MGYERIKRLKSGKTTLAKIAEDVNHTLVIHYSCESFYDRTDGKSPRVTSIAARNLGSGQTYSFSIHQVSERQKTAFDEIESNYDMLEKQMLTEFYEFASKHEQYNWLHWNMRDVNYGFPALEHRARVLGIESPFHINENLRFDLARIMVDLFGIQYAGHPRLGSLVEMNKITDRDMLMGDMEAKAFENHEYVKLHQSTLRKVDILANLFYRTQDGTLKTKATWSQIHGGLFPGFTHFIQTHWIVSLFGFVGTIVGLAIAIFGGS